MNELYFYDHEVSLKTDSVVLNADESRHIEIVLRLKKGNKVYVVNGKGLLAEAQIDRIDKYAVELKLLNKKQFIKSNPEIHIVVGLLKQKDRIENIVEKLTELGVGKISFVNAKRSERSGINVERLEKISISALKQSKNLFLPEITYFQNFSSLFEKTMLFNGYKVIAYCGASIVESLKKTISWDKDCMILIGPEGDFTPEEVDLAIGKGFVPVSLGVSRLRSDTSAIYVGSVIKSIYEV